MKNSSFYKPNNKKKVLVYNVLDDFVSMLSNLHLYKQKKNVYMRKILSFVNLIIKKKFKFMMCKNIEILT